MPKYDVWFTIFDEYVVTVEADSFEQANDMVHDDPQSVFLGRSWLEAGVNITNYQEVQDEG